MVPGRSLDRARSALAGGLAGLVGGVAFAAALSYGLDIMPVLADVYGYEGDTTIQTVLGSVAHLGHSFVFGAVFGALVAHRRLGAWAEKLLPAAALGLAYGVVLWTGASFLAPAIVDATTGWTVRVPYWDLGLLGVNLGFGLVVGLLHPRFERWLSTDDASSAASSA